MARIVVADDHPWIVRQLRNRLEQDRHTVFTAYDGEKALRLIHDEKPDLILLDLSMPLLDGLRVLHRVRESDETQLTPVVMLTGQAHPEDVALAARLGVDCYLTKPVTMDEVAIVVKRLLEARQSTLFRISLILACELFRIDEEREVTLGGRSSDVELPGLIRGA